MDDLLNVADAGADSEDVVRTNAVLSRLVSEWRAIRGRLELPPSATVQEIATRLKLSWSTAQKLNRIGRIANVRAEDLKLFPAAKTWEQVVKSAEGLLGADHKNIQALSLAVDQFVNWIETMGGSRVAAMRHATGAIVGEPVPSEPLEIEGYADRAQLVHFWGKVCKYLTEELLLTQFIRRSPDSTDDKLDVATLQGFKGCRGKPGAMPLAFRTVAISRDEKLITREGGEQFGSFQLLHSLCSKPIPPILSSGDSVQQMVFVEPQWAISPGPLDLPFCCWRARLCSGAVKIRQSNWRQSMCIPVSS